ncbi:Fe(3+)-hydroxamate ABC transporter permease FhuB [Burkholderia multivorans]|uniref:Fe(3+)-hydroxamate ABC transporter permease FhuB n=1 Tax=Burkholderia multivorans TaxID=87883 RepID=UPI001C9569BA|nr:Fe(3+)-hydroxamate ABC transporter permease FhuB [Burkholderia multivorans]MBY4674330.1 Fe(3+)-hydroxamate ABC transporter permease FhuB [Burkholderia multivorans]
MSDNPSTTLQLCLPYGHPVLLVGVCTAMALFLCMHRLDSLLPVSFWYNALVRPDYGDMRQIIVHDSLYPRVAVALMSGALLSLSGAIFQQLLRNPLAEPTTLGVSGGAALALSIVTVWAPDVLVWGREIVTIGGAALAMILVMAIAWRQRFSPFAVVLAGLAVSLYCGAVNTIVVLLHHDQLWSVFNWGAGALAQNNWGVAQTLALYLLSGLVVAMTLSRPLTILSLGDESARSLGTSLGLVRSLCLTLAVALSAAVVAAVGVIGFVGFVVPTIVRLLHVRTLKGRMFWAPLLGASLVWLTDEIIQSLGAPWSALPTGTVISFLGAPALIWLLIRLRAESITSNPPTTAIHTALPLSDRYCLMAISLMALMGMTVVALFLGRDSHGWHWLGRGELAVALHWRFARTAAAFSAGAMLAMAGVVVQRLTGNAMSSPEILGISSGASLGLIVVMFFMTDVGRPGQWAASSLGAVLALGGVLALGRRSTYSPSHMMLVGVALGTVFSAFSTLVVLSGQKWVFRLLTWMAGSTYRVTWEEAVFSGGALVVLAPVALTVWRWLEILPLGEGFAASLGVPLSRSRVVLVVLAALLTAGGTLVTGPLSFVGLLAPHAARLAGFTNARTQLLGAAIMGALMMVLADWLGRNIAFPYQIPAGTLATLAGGAYFMGAISRKKG